MSRRFALAPAVLIGGLLAAPRLPAQSSPPAPGAAVAGRPVANPVVPLPAFRRAVERGTRTTTGVPGPNYWQQWARYTIRARLDVEAKRLEGTTRIVYRNASPDTLRVLALQLLQNFHREDAPRFRQGEITGGYTLTRVTVGGEALPAPDSVPRRPYRTTEGTYLYLFPTAPLRPRDSVAIELEWSFRIPRSGVGARMGWNADNFYYLAYFYPQMAVYDDVVGWQTDPFLGPAEFYMGYGSYDVTLDVPEGWLVQGTGRLVNEREVLPERVSERLRLAESSDTVVHVLTDQDLGPGRATRPGAGGRLSWRFAADSVRDVAYAITLASVWDAGRVAVGDRNGDGRSEYALAAAIYRPAHQRWRQVARYAQQSIAHHSSYTGLPYPYPHLTAVEGAGIIGGGMEYPMMTLIGGYDQQSDTSMYAVTSHELAHNWFPMIVGVDERRYGWMDEGTTNFNELAAAAEFFPGFNAEGNEFANYLSLARTGEEGALMRHSDALDSPAHYGVYAYSKPASLLLTLRNLLGVDAFTRAYQGYARAWAFRHPKPWDFFNAFNAATGEDLSWFWRTWYYETWTLDQAVDGVSRGRRGTEITVRDRGDAPMPARLTIVLSGGDTLRREVPVATWLAGARTATVAVPRGEVVSVEIDAAKQFPDVTRKNNLWLRGADSLPAALPLVVRTDLLRMRRALEAKGYRSDGEPLSGSAAGRSTELRILTLEAGVPYAVLGVCDQECSDLDLEVQDSARTRLVRDIELNDTPVIELTPAVTGSYRLLVTMYDCRTAACAWTAQLFRRPR